jgi:hypothetical protein
MPEAVSRTKDPTKVRAGRVGAERRWGSPGVVRLDELTPPQRRLVLALVEAAKAERSDGGQAA